MKDFDLYMPSAWTDDGLLEELALQPDRVRPAPRRQPWLSRFGGVVVGACVATVTLSSGLFVGDEQPAVARLLELEHGAVMERAGPHDRDLIDPSYWQRLSDRLASYRRVGEAEDDDIELPDPFA